MTGHCGAITSIFFTLSESWLVTASVDNTIRYWCVDTGANVKVFTDTAAPLSVALMPFNRSLFVVSTSGKFIRVVCSVTGKVLQKLKMEAEVRVMEFDDSGLYCFAASKTGQINVLQVEGNSTLLFKYKTVVSQGAITCMTFVPSRSPHERPLLIVNSCDSKITILECIYTKHTGTCLLSLRVCRRLKLPHQQLPLRNCFLSTGCGWILSGSEDNAIFCFPLREKASSKATYHLCRHSTPVLAVTTNSEGTVIASGDSSGAIILWRRLEPIN